MIRNVVMGRLRAPRSDQDAALDLLKLEEGLAGIAALNLPGQLAMHVGRDLGLREGGWTFAITNDWVDEAAYRAYDLDAEHNEYRAMVGSVCEPIARVQFRVGE